MAGSIEGELKRVYGIENPELAGDNLDKIAWHVNVPRKPNEPDDYYRQRLAIAFDEKGWVHYSAELFYGKGMSEWGEAEWDNYEFVVKLQLNELLFAPEEREET